MASAKVFTLTVIGKPRVLTFAELGAVKASKSTLGVWPVVRPHYVKGDAGDKVRKANYWAAVTAAVAEYERLAMLAAQGWELRVVVESGAVLQGDKATQTFANVVRPDLLAEIARNSASVTVHANSDDPREYVALDD